MSLLLVDDEPGILSALRRLFRPLGYTIHTAQGGAEGLQVLEREPVDLVISDMRMPEMSGAQFLEQVRQRWPDTVRILLTGYADMGSTIKAINRGEIYRYVAKPWDDTELTLLVRDALQAQRLRRENTRLLALTQAQNEQLKQLNDGLELMVAQRTSELEQVNSFLSQANGQLRHRFLISIKMFSGLLEMRGGAVAGHSRRVAELARRLAEHMRLDRKLQHDIFLAGLLHDIGKIGMPDILLNRPVSKMVGLDMVDYCKHAAAGEAALRPLDELKDVARIVRSHHERFDGHGFPDNLVGEEISLGTRILSVANDYDGLQIGLLSETKMTASEARAMLQQSRGKAYDPQVVNAFIDMLDLGKARMPPEHVVPAAEAAAGMVLARDLTGANGALLLAADSRLDETMVRQLQDYAQRAGSDLTLHVRADR